MIQSIIASSRQRPPPRYREPLPSRLRRGLLLLAWLAGAGVLLTLLFWQVKALTATGLVEAMPVPAASLLGGRVAQIQVAIGDTVKAGDVVARLDDQDVRGRLAAAEAGLEAARALLTAQLANLEQTTRALIEDHHRSRLELEVESLRDEHEQIDSRARIAIAQQKARLDQALLDQELQSARAENELVLNELKRREGLADRGLMILDEMVTLRQRQAFLAATLTSGPRRSVVLCDALKTLDDIHTAQTTMPKPPPHDALVRDEACERSLQRQAGEVLIQTFNADKNLREREIAALRHELHDRTVTSPVNGTVHLVMLPAGTVATAGSPIVLVVPSPAHRAIAWVDERQARFIQVGDTVDIMPSGMGRRALPGRVVATGAAVDLVPFAARLHFSSTARGLPVLVSIAGGQVVPGERVEMRFGGVPWWATVSW